MKPSQGRKTPRIGDSPLLLARDPRIITSMKDKDFAWLTEHGAELIRQYAGKWIAVADGKIVGIGDTAPEAAQQATEKVPAGEFILEHVNAEVDAIYELS